MDYIINHSYNEQTGLHLVHYHINLVRLKVQCTISVGISAQDMTNPMDLMELEKLANSRASAIKIQMDSLPSIANIHVGPYIPIDSNNLMFKEVQL